MKPVLDVNVLTEVHLFTTSRALCHNEENQKQFTVHCTPGQTPRSFSAARVTGSLQDNRSLTPGYNRVRRARQTPESARR